MPAHARSVTPPLRFRFSSFSLAPRRIPNWWPFRYIPWVPAPGSLQAAPPRVWRRHVPSWRRAWRSWDTWASRRSPSASLVRDRMAAGGFAAIPARPHACGRGAMRLPRSAMKCHSIAGMNAGMNRTSQPDFLPFSASLSLTGLARPQQSCAANQCTLCAYLSLSSPVLPSCCRPRLQAASAPRRRWRRRR